MIKIIHCIKVGRDATLGNFELHCIDSWKKYFPGWEIRYWYDDEILPMIQDCTYAKTAYENGNYAFAMDYVKLKILDEYGGLYMDTDVLAVNEIPASYFKHSFTSFDAGFDTNWAQNGNCMYCNKPHNKYVVEAIEMYKGFDEYTKDPNNDNTCFHFILRDHGLDTTNRLGIRFTDAHLKYMDVLNCIQFAGYDYILNRMTPNPNKLTRYLVHCRTKSWMGYKAQDTALYYAILDDNTDMTKLSKAVDAFIKMDVSKSKIKHSFVLIINTLDSEMEENISMKFLSSQLVNKNYIAAPMGDHLDNIKLLDVFTDYVSKQYNKIKYVRNILEGDFTGDIHV